MYERVSCSCTDIVSLLFRSSVRFVLSRFSRSSEQTNDPSIRIVRRSSRSCFMYNVEPEESRHDLGRKRVRRFEAPSFRPFVSISLSLSLSLWIFDAEKKNARGRVSLIVNGCTFRSIKISLRVHVRCSFHGRRLDREIMYMYYFRGSFDSTFRLFAETLPSVIRASFLSTTFATLFSSRSLNLPTVRSQSFLSFFSPSRG